MAAGGSKGTGSHDICTFPHGPLPGSGGRSVLSVCKETGGHERNRPQNGIHRRNKAGKRCWPVHLCVAQTHPKAPGEGKGGTGKTNRAEERFRHRFHAGGRTASYPFRTRNGKRKSPQQREWEEQWTLLERWKAYERKLAIMGESRNSYSKTDPDATFMRMKEDHMRNGQLKPGITSRSQSTANTSRVWRCSQTAATQRRSVP